MSDTTTTTTAERVKLPNGVSVVGGRETSEAQNNTVVQGMVFTLKLPGGATTSVFVPYDDLANIPQVESILNARVQAIMAVTGSGS